MLKPEDHENEQERLKNLESYAILDTLSEKDYDDLTAIAAEICGTEISLISLVDDKRQWFKSHHGLAASETPKDIAFCAHAINDQENVFIVPDARKDKRFHDNPLVTDDPLVIFYAGVPLVSDNGLPLGTLCVIDHEPKQLDEGQIKSLRALGNQVMNLLNLRKTRFELEKSFKTLEAKNLELERFATVAAHDLKSPLIGISSLIEILSESNGNQLDGQGKEMLRLIGKSSDKLSSLIDGLLDYSKCESVLKDKKSNIQVSDLVNDMRELFTNEKNLKIVCNSNIKEIVINRAAIDQIFINLLTNSIKYNDKENIEIEIGLTETEGLYEFYVEDNGPGIDPKYHDRIFEIFEVLSNKDRYGKQGNGIGLAAVKKVIENSGGAIRVCSEEGRGARFTFSFGK